MANFYMSWRGAKRRGHLIHFLLPLMVKILIVEIASLRSQGHRIDPLSSISGLQVFINAMNHSLNFKGRNILGYALVIKL